MQRHVIETIIGAVVLLVAAGFLVFAYKGSDMQLSNNEGYTVKAKFSNLTGINTGSDVRVGGIKVGVVSNLELDPKTYEAVAFFNINNGIRLPEDSSAAIASAGLLGEKFVQLTPGSDDAMLKDGGRIQFTQSSISLEELIGKFVFSGDKDKGGKQVEPTGGRQTN